MIAQLWQMRKKELNSKPVQYALEDYQIIAKLDTNKTDYQKCPLCNVADGTSLKRNEQAAQASLANEEEGVEKRGLR